MGRILTCQYNDGEASCSETSSRCNALCKTGFVKCEGSEKIGRAFRHPIRATEETFNPGDSVFYVKDGKNRWLRSGKVIFQDDKVVFVRYGGVYLRVSGNILINDVCRTIKVSTNILVNDVCRTEPVPLGCNVEEQHHAAETISSTEVILEHLPEQEELSVQPQQRGP